MDYGLRTETNLEFKDAIEKAEEELKKEGFGILTEIDVKRTLKEKLNVDCDNYIILGACNPSSAYKAFQAEKKIGLLLPCNVIVYTENEKTIISAINPSVAMGMIENESLKEISSEVEAKLRRVIFSFNIKGKEI